MNLTSIPLIPTLSFGANQPVRAQIKTETKPVPSPAIVRPASENAPTYSPTAASQYQAMKIRMTM